MVLLVIEFVALGQGLLSLGDKNAGVGRLVGQGGLVGSKILHPRRQTPIFVLKVVRADPQHRLRRLVSTGVVSRYVLVAILNLWIAFSR